MESKKKLRKLTNQEKDIIKLIRGYQKQNKEVQKQRQPTKRNTMSDKNLSRWGGILNEINEATKKAKEQIETKSRQKSHNRRSNSSEKASQKSYQSKKSMLQESENSPDKKKDKTVKEKQFKVSGKRFNRL